MKKTLILFVFLIAFKVMAQDPELFEHTWYLHDLIINGKSNPPPDFELNDISLNFYKSSPDNFITYACDNGTGDVIYDEINSSFSFSVFGIVNFGCDHPPNEIYDDLYFSFYENEIDNPFIYNISLNNGIFSLIITSQLGNQAVYGNQILNTSALVKDSAFIFPNPAKDLLTIESQTVIEKATIYNTLGAKLKEVTNSFNEISLAGIPSGLLLVALETEKGKVIEKIVKE